MEVPMSEETVSQTDDQEFEEISSDEVDRIVEVLDNLIEGVDSDNIKHYLEEASSNIYYLVYEDAEDESEATAADETAVEEVDQLRDAA
jgi:DNA-binding transcriptional regulator GbsR (MarR family)